jgi:hypothetical protein
LSKLKVYVRKSDLTRGPEIDDYAQITLTPKYNDVGGWTLNLNKGSQSADALLAEDGYGIIVERANSYLFSGITELPHRSWKANSSDTVTFSGVDDNVWLARRLALPSAPPFTASAYDEQSGVDAETAMRHYVDVNLGPSADALRQLPGLTLAPNGHLGPTVDDNGRFNTVLEVVQRIAIGAGLGFRIVPSGSGLQFQVFEPIDRSSSVVFGPTFGNLESFDYAAQAPTANYIYVGGGGEGTSRVIAPDGDWASIGKWGRREAFRDRRDTSDATILNQTITEELIKQGEQQSLSIVPAEYEPAAAFTGETFTPYRLGVDYNVGDIISINVDGLRISERVQSSEIKVAGPSLTSKPLIGTSNASDPEFPDIFNTVRDLARQVKTLQAR